MLAIFRSKHKGRLGSPVFFVGLEQETYKKTLHPRHNENGSKIISFYAKKARGAMARYIMENRLSDPNSLLEFDLGGYKYQPEKSTLESPIFLRD